MDSCSQVKELGAQKLAQFYFIDRITGRKSQDLLPPEMLNINIIMCDMHDSAIDKHVYVVCSSINLQFSKLL